MADRWKPVEINGDVFWEDHEDLPDSTEYEFDDLTGGQR